MQPVWPLRICQTLIILLFNQLTECYWAECAVLIQWVFHFSDGPTTLLIHGRTCYLDCCIWTIDVAQ